MQRRTFTALNSTFIVDADYEFVKELGQGAYGCVVAAKHRTTGETVAIKKITNINTKVALFRVVQVRSSDSDRIAEDIDEAMPARDQVSARS